MVIVAAQPRFGFWTESFITAWRGLSFILPSKYKAVTSESLGKSMVLNAELTEGTGTEELHWPVSLFYFREH
jgi:hypothetical protein